VNREKECREETLTRCALTSRAAKKACKALYPEIKARVQAHHRRENRKLAMLKYSRRLLYYNLRW
jgi:DNA-binding GntR family transcriptional regulator